ncbi:hypothetical protein [Paenibacillus sp. FSL P4-0081]|nr:hypothetical protein [Paenibacillus sp. FSL P4-0081]
MTQEVEKCERCGCNYLKKDDSDVCGVCLVELEFEDELEEEDGAQP